MTTPDYRMLWKLKRQPEGEHAYRIVVLGTEVFASHNRHLVLQRYFAERKTAWELDPEIVVQLFCDGEEFKLDRKLP